jgi:hypothetical protein
MPAAMSAIEMPAFDGFSSVSVIATRPASHSSPSRSPATAKTGPDRDRKAYDLLVLDWTTFRPRAGNVYAARGSACRAVARQSAARSGAASSRWPGVRSSDSPADSGSASGPWVIARIPSLPAARRA